MRLTYGIHNLQANIAGLSVAETQLAYRDVLSVADEAEAYRNGRRADGRDLLRIGDELEFVKPWGRKGGEEEQKRIAEALERIADYLAPQQRAIVGTKYVAQRLGVTVKWVGDLVRQGTIPKGCIIPQSGNGRYWRFDREKIDRWIEEN